MFFIYKKKLQDMLLIKAYILSNINYNLLINIRVVNKRTNLGNIYFENTYIIITSKIKAKVTWFIK